MTKRIFHTVVAAVVFALAVCAAVTVWAVYAGASLYWFLAAITAAVVAAVGFSWWLTRRMTEKMVQSLMKDPQGSRDYAELLPVLEHLDYRHQQQAERTRQEFTANVSHELKTPLQSIIGSAELLENGLVKPQDMSRFVGHIKTEASRLLSLINDIIRLSQLDENTQAARESVDLYQVAAEVIEELTVLAAGRKVKLELVGKSCVITGIRRYLYEIIYNLCDNAIRYNVEGGKVTVGIRHDRQGVALWVEDTGIGIPREHQGRIFERFYRVDKSHSKKTGGTGLGLSIVKHAAAYHGGRIELDSTPGKGTTVKIHLSTDEIRQPEVSE